MLLGSINYENTLWQEAVMSSKQL